MTGIAITSPEETSLPIKAALKALFKRVVPRVERHLSVDIDALEIHTKEQHDDWEPKEPCPECGNEEFRGVYAEERIMRFADGEMIASDHGRMAWAEMNFVCTQCDTQLSSHPAVELLSD